MGKSSKQKADQAARDRAFKAARERTAAAREAAAGRNDNNVAPQPQISPAAMGKPAGMQDSAGDAPLSRAEEIRQLPELVSLADPNAVRATHEIDLFASRNMTSRSCTNLAPSTMTLMLSRGSRRGLGLTSRRQGKMTPTFMRR
jgi:hypothetical protein